MSTINHTIKHLNQDETGYDTYHIETNTEQVYDFDSGKWLNEIVAELQRELRVIADIVNNLTLHSEISSLKSRILQLEESLLIVSEQSMTYVDEQFVEYEAKRIKSVVTERFTSINNQKIFELENIYDLSTDFIKVEVGGVEQYSNENYMKYVKDGATLIEFGEFIPTGVPVIITYMNSDTEALNTIVDNHINNSAINHVSISEVSPDINDGVTFVKEEVRPDIE